MNPQDEQYQELYELFYKGLQKYAPEKSLPTLIHWLIHHGVTLTVTGSRKSKRGDYRPPQRGKGHRISVNGDLNPYAFLTTLTHEVAHLITFEQYGNSVQSHGKEWKRNFQKLMLFFLKKDIYPPDVEKAIYGYMRNPAASSCTSSELIRAFKKYDAAANLPDGWEAVFVEDVPKGSYFIANNGKTFLKGKKLRKRYECSDAETGQCYRFSPIAEVMVKKKT